MTKPVAGQSVRKNTELLDFPVGTIVVATDGMSVRIGHEIGVGTYAALQDRTGHAFGNYALAPERFNSFPMLPLDVEHPEGEMVVVWVPA